MLSLLSWVLYSHVCMRVCEWEVERRGKEYRHQDLSSSSGFGWHLNDNVGHTYHALVVLVVPSIHSFIHSTFP